MSSSTAPSGSSRSSRSPRKPALSLVADGEHEDDARAAQQLVEARRLGVRAPDRELGEPRVVDEDRAAERHEHAAQRTAEVAEPDDADRAAGEQEGAGVRVEPPLLAARAHGPVGGADPAREIDRHAERRLGDGHRERRAGAEDVDAALARGRVVDVGQEVALDVDHRPQLRGAGEPLRRQVGLAEDRDRLGQVRLDRRGGHRLGVAHDEPPERFEPGARRRVADHVERPRQRVDEDERLRHARHPLNRVARAGEPGLPPPPAQRDAVAGRPAVALGGVARGLERGARREHAPLVALGQLGQPRGLVDGIADDGVLEALGRPDVARHRAAGRHADAEVGGRHVRAQPRPQRPRGGERVARGVGALQRRAEHAQRGVALELVDRAAVLVDRRHDGAEELVEQRDDLQRRALRGELRRADEVDEQDRDVALLAAQLDAALERHGAPPPRRPGARTGRAAARARAAPPPCG